MDTIERFTSAQLEVIARRLAGFTDRKGPIPAHRPSLGRCHLWTGSRFVSGYGDMRVNGRNRLAHRVAFLVAEGRWPEPCGLHLCDNPPCVRRSHLREGTLAENSADMVAKGRAPRRGDLSHARKLSQEQVLVIREVWALGERTQRSLAVEYGVTPATICLLLSGKTWAHSSSSGSSPPSSPSNSST
jgi:hypothetical protein